MITFLLASGEFFGHVQVGLDWLVFLYSGLRFIRLRMLNGYHFWTSSIAASGTQRTRRQFLFLLQRSDDLCLKLE